MSESTQVNRSPAEQPIYRRILVATGGGAHSQVAVVRASALAEQFGAVLHVVTVVPQSSGPLMKAALAFPGAETFEAQAMQDDFARREAHLKRTAEDLRVRGFTVIEHLVPSLTPADAILRVAAEVQADLIVLGRKHRSAWTAALAGSVSDLVSHASPVDVLITR